jgi:hypothetical protein
VSTECANDFNVIPRLNSYYLLLISNFRRVLNVVCLLLGNSAASEFYIPTFRNTLFHLNRQVDVKKFFTPTCL